VQPDGVRTLQPLPNPAAWCRCFDFLQVNEDEMEMMAPDPLGLAAIAMSSGVSTLNVTMGRRGVVYFAAPGFDRLSDLDRNRLHPATGPIRTELLPAYAARTVLDGDPTGCGDVWGATYFSRLLAGDNIAEAMRLALMAAAKNVDHRGASGLARYLRGELAVK
jgi:sugar/nucleoside kinase (ribokinase family)